MCFTWKRPSPPSPLPSPDPAPRLCCLLLSAKLGEKRQPIRHHLIFNLPLWQSMCKDRTTRTASRLVRAGGRSSGRGPIACTLLFCLKRANQIVKEHEK